MKLFKTGIVGLDEFLSGGLPPRVLLLNGLPGSGKEVFARQIAHNRAKQFGITYFVFDRTPDSIKEDMALYNWDIELLEAAGLWKFRALSKKDDIDKIVAEEIERKRTIVMDSLSEVLMFRKIEEVLSLLTFLCRSNDGSSYHLFLLTKGMQDRKVEIALEHYVEGVISFNTVITSDHTQRDILIKKMNGIIVPSRRLPYNINKRGFVVETATRIT